MRTVRAVAVMVGVSFFLQGVLSDAADWPLYRGPNQDGISLEKVAVQWSGSPKVVWRTPTNTGFSSFAVSDGKVFHAGRRRQFTGNLPGPGRGNGQGTLDRRYRPRPIPGRWRFGRRR